MRKHLFFYALYLLVPFILFAQNSSPVVTDIDVSNISDNRIEISWILPERTAHNTVSQIKVYRSTTPINNVDELEPISVLPGNFISYIDNPPDSKEYFYAVITVIEDVADGSDVPYNLLLPGVNSTTVGVHLKKTTPPVQVTKTPKRRSYEEDELREQPLPYMNILGDSRSKSTSLISKESEQKALALVSFNKKASVPQKLTQYIFEEDSEAPIAGDDYLLYEILQNSFLKEDYVKSIEEINNFLSINRSASSTDRATFYLGECYYFTNEYERALTCFLEVQSSYTSLSRKWSQSSLDLYQIP